MSRIMALGKFLDFLKAQRLYFIVSALLVIIALDRVNIFMLNESKVVYIGIFNGVAVFPNDFAIDAGASNEILLRGEIGSVLIGKRVSPELFQYMQEHAQKKINKCGIDIIKERGDGENNSTLLYNSDNYMYLVGVEEDVEDRAIKSLCSTT